MRPPAASSRGLRAAPTLKLLALTTDALICTAAARRALFSSSINSLPETTAAALARRRRPTECQPPQPRRQRRRRPHEILRRHPSVSAASCCLPPLTPSRRDRRICGGFDGGCFSCLSTSFSPTVPPSAQEDGSAAAPATSSWTVDDKTGVVSRRCLDSNSNKKALITPVYQVVVGFEIHVQISAALPTDKLFSSFPPLSSPDLPQSSIKPNRWFHPFDAAVPGYLPLLGLKSSGSKSNPPTAAAVRLVEKAVRAAILCRSRIRPVSRFERKHYHYADLPHGYQVTQQRWPLATGGLVHTTGGDSHRGGDCDDDDIEQGACRIERIQLEMDTAKTTAASSLSSSSSWIDLDRAGMPLLEIVTLPDVRSPQQAVRTVRNLHSLLMRCGVTRGRLERGEFRMDVNVNLEQLNKPRKRSGRVEVKNLNSFSHVHDSIVYEAVRQARLWGSHGPGRDDEEQGAFPGGQETRTWDAALERTILMRRKDTAQEYRFLPEPDLPALLITSRFVDRVRQSIPELSSQVRERLVRQYGIPSYQATILVQEASGDAVRLFEETCRHLQLTGPGSESGRTEPPVSPKLATAVANLIGNELFSLIGETARESDPHDAPNHEDGDDFFSEARLPLQAWQLSEIVSMLHEGTISQAVAKKALALTASHAKPAAAPIDAGSTNATVLSPRHLVHDMGWQLVGDRDELLAVCRQVLQNHPKQVAEYSRCATEEASASHRKVQDGSASKARRNQQRLVKLFMGKAMKASGGNAHPERLQEALQDALDEMVSTTTTTAK